MICAGKEPGSKCKVEGMVWREERRLQGESGPGYASAQSVTVADKVCKVENAPLDPAGPGSWGKKTLGVWEPELATGSGSCAQ